MLTVLDEYSRQALCVAVKTRMGSVDVVEALYPLLLKHGKPESIRSELPVNCAIGSSNHWRRTRVHRGHAPGMVDKGRYQTNPDPSRLVMGGRLRRAVQRNLAKRSHKCRVVQYNKTSANRHQWLAQAIQSSPPSSGTEHASAKSRNLTKKLLIKWGLDSHCCPFQLAWPVAITRMQSAALMTA